MRFFSQSIEIGRVDSADTTYHISTPTPVEDLVKSIHQHGMITPPILREKTPGRFIIVSGFRRISACRKLCWDRMDARITDQASSDLECLRLAILDNAVHRPLNTIEQSIAICKLGLFIDDERQLCQEAGSAGLQVNPELVRKLKQVALLYPELLAPLLSGVIPLTIALELGNLDKDAACLFLQVFETLKPTLNHQKEIVSLARESALARNVPVASIIKDVAELIADDQPPDRFQKIQKIRAHLQRLRYPEISRFEKVFQERLMRLNLPDFIRLTAPPHFEGTGFGLSITFDNMEQFQSGIDFLSRLTLSPDFKKIIDKAIEDHPPIH